MSYSITIRQASILADANQRYWDTMFALRKEAGIPIGCLFDMGDANLLLSAKLTGSSDDEDLVLEDGTVVNYDDWFTAARIIKLFKELEFHSLNGGRGTGCDSLETADAREARRLFAFWISQFRP